MFISLLSLDIYGRNCHLFQALSQKDALRYADTTLNYLTQLIYFALMSDLSSSARPWRVLIFTSGE